MIYTTDVTWEYCYSPGRIHGTMEQHLIECRVEKDDLYHHSCNRRTSLHRYSNAQAKLTEQVTNWVKSWEVEAYLVHRPTRLKLGKGKSLGSTCHQMVGPQRARLVWTGLPSHSLQLLFVSIVSTLSVLRYIQCKTHRRLFLQCGRGKHVLTHTWCYPRLFMITLSLVPPDRIQGKYARAPWFTVAHILHQPPPCTASHAIEK